MGWDWAPQQSTRFPGHVPAPAELGRAQLAVHPAPGPPDQMPVQQLDPGHSCWTWQCPLLFLRSGWGGQPRVWVFLLAFQQPCSWSSSLLFVLFCQLPSTFLQDRIESCMALPATSCLRRASGEVSKDQRAQGFERWELGRPDCGKAPPAHGLQGEGGDLVVAGRPGACLGT